MSKALIIVESPTKVKTLKKYLGKSFDVKASVGHIRDLPVKSLGVDVEHDFEPQYVTIRGKGKIVSELKNAAKKADRIFLAPDPDREGEAIAYHIAHCLGSSQKPVSRVLFHELTKKAVLAAIDKSSELNLCLFEAQQARRILDRLVGYQISPLLWEKVRRGLSAGRVQSVAVRMVCEREQEVESFVSEEYWTIDIHLKGTLPPSFNARLDRIDGKKKKVEDQVTADMITADLQQADFVVEKVEKKEKKRHPAPPFITSTLQIDANRKLRFSAKKTMTIAQKLYEGIELGKAGPVGLITYMRTDSTRIGGEALSAARTYIKKTFGPDYLPPKPRVFKSKKSAQDAHEAIRPTDVSNTPDSVAPYLDRNKLSLYTLIWKRFVASQMNPALFDQTKIQINAGKYSLKAVGSIMRFLGFMTLYIEAVEESSSDPDKKRHSDRDVTLPDLTQGDRLQLLNILPKQHFTQPPARYTEATLVKALEENGVGRPSTYAAILSTIQDKEYVILAERKFSPTDLGKLVNGLLVDHFPGIMNVEFTASMEEKLDHVEEGKIKWLDVLREFYGPFKERLNLAKEKMKSVKRSGVPTDIPCSECDGMMVIKWGRMGEFLACEKYPECKHTQNFKKLEDGAIVPIEKEEPEETGKACEKCGRPMVYKHGRYGKFLACSGYPECKHIPAITTGVKCPQDGCKGEIVQKKSKRGKIFYSCNQYPKCKFALWDKPVNKTCPKCGASFLLEKETKKMGSHLKCADQSCGYLEKK